MGSFRKHLDIAKEKLASVTEAYHKKRYTVVGDLATKVVEQLVEADAARSGRHFGSHRERHKYCNKSFTREINGAMQKIWFVYGDLGYDGTNGKRARAAMANLGKVVKFFKGRFDETITQA